MSAGAWEPTAYVFSLGDRKATVELGRALWIWDVWSVTAGGSWRIANGSSEVLGDAQRDAVASLMMRVPQ